MNKHWRSTKKILMFDLESYFLEVKNWDFKTISFSCVTGKTIVVKYLNTYVLMPVGAHFVIEHPYLRHLRLHLETKPQDELQALRIFKAS